MPDVSDSLRKGALRHVFYATNNILEVYLKEEAWIHVEVKM